MPASLQLFLASTAHINTRVSVNFISPRNPFRLIFPRSLSKIKWMTAKNPGKVSAPDFSCCHHVRGACRQTRRTFAGENRSVGLQSRPVRALNLSRIRLEMLRICHLSPTDCGTNATHHRTTRPFGAPEQGRRVDLLLCVHCWEVEHVPEHHLNICQILSDGSEILQ